MEFIQKLFDTSGFMPHGHCYLWTPILVYMNVISDGLIFAAYSLISISLILLITKVKEIPFQTIYAAFGLFIVACGVTHFMEIINVWIPTYWASASVKVITAIASVGTACLLPFYFRKARDLARGALLFKTQEALRNSEALYRQIVDTANEGIWLLDPDNKTKFVNRRMAEILGFTTEEMMGCSLSDFMDSEEIQKVDESRNRHVEGTVENHVFKMRHKNGSDVWARVACNPIFDSEGKISSSLGMVTDITMKRVAEEKLRLSEIHYRSLVEAVPQLVWSHRLDGGADYCNPNLIEHLGFTPVQVIDDLLAVIHPDERDLTQALWEDAFLRQVAIECEYRLLRHDGVYRWQLSRIIPLRDGEGHLIKWMGIATDIHEQKLSEETTRTLERNLTTLLDNAPIILWATDLEGTITLSQGKALQNLGCKSGELVGTKISEFEEGAGILRDRERVRNGESWTSVKQYGGYWFETHHSPSRDNEGRIVGQVAVSTDITERREAEIAQDHHRIREASAQEASRLKSEFLAHMSHEIRTPLNGVIGMVSLISDTILDAEQREYTENALRSGEMLMNVVNDVLDLSKIEAGKLDFESIDFDLFDLIHESEKDLFYAARSKGLRLYSKIDPEAPRFIQADPNRLKQVITNLLSNAIKFTESGSIHLNLCKVSGDAGESLLFEVVDTGIGISQDGLGKLFNAFSQADSSTTRRFGGTGLGLSISKHLVERMEGRIGAESTEGVGSKFWFTIRLKKGAPAHRALHKVSPMRAETSANILVADDNLINRKVILKFLDSMGYRAQAVSNGRDALEALREQTYQLILMDCHMPEMDGYECTQTIRQGEEHYRDIPIVALTASAMKKDYDRAFEAGMNAYIAKPLKKDILNEVLTGLLNPTRISQTESDFALSARNPVLESF